jgi:hypothetical protein
LSPRDLRADSCHENKKDRASGAVFFIAGEALAKPFEVPETRVQDDRVQAGNVS